MSNTLHNVLNDTLVTKQNLIDQGFKIDKKRVMIDSRAYTEDAFEYVLKLADIAGSLVFVYDTKKIWANGRYFGGDIFEEDLKYFTNLYTIDDFGTTTGITSATSSLSNLFIQGKSHLDVKAVQNNDEPFYKNILEFDYKLDEAVNSDEYVTIGGSKYNLVVENDQIKINEYIPMKVVCSSLPVLEYDSVDYYTQVSFNISASGTMPNKDKVKIAITSEPEVTIDQKGTNVIAQIPRNTEVTFTIKYEDGITFGETHVTQKWGYGVWVGYFNGNGFTEPSSLTLKYMTNFDGDGLETTKKYLWVPGTKINLTESINQNNYSWGIFVGPSNLNYDFIDTSTNLTGGWSPLFEKIGDLYEDNINYIPYVTDHRGLGLVTWKIKGE